MLKVRGFQVAPAELEGCILDHPDVTDTCVVGIRDDYSGELPLAFVVLRPTVAKRVEEDPGAMDGIKASIMKVSTLDRSESILLIFNFTARCRQQSCLQEARWWR